MADDLIGRPPVADERPASTHRARRATRLPGPTGLLWASGIVFALLAATAVGLDRQLRWDEVTYLAQVTPGQPDVWFGPQRARGMTVVLLPVALLGAPLTALRIWLIAVHAAALVVAFRPWVHAAGFSGGAAAMVTAVSWVPLYFAVEAYPNLLAAFAAVAAAGFTTCWVLAVRARSATVPRDRDLVAAAVAIAVVAWLRPTESVWIAAALTVIVVVLTGRRAIRPIVAYLVGGFVGWLPWLVEAIARFGGPFARLDAARASSASGEPRNSLIQYVNLVEGPVRRVVEDPVLTGPALLLLVGLALLAAVGLLAPGPRERRVAALIGAWCALVMVLPYLALNAGINLRYLLPGMLLLAVPVGAGCATLVTGLLRAPLLIAVPGLVGLAALAGFTVVWQTGLARSNSDDIAALQARPVLLGEALAAAADSAPCAFASNVQWPEVQWHSGCLGEVLDPDNALLQCHHARRNLAALAADGFRVFVLRRGDPPFSSAVEGWPVRRLEEPEAGVWWLYERPEDLGPDDPPTVPDPEDSTTPCPPSRAPDTSEARLTFSWSRPEP